MRAREFITEEKLDKIHDGLDLAFDSLPYTYIIPDLKNQDFYELYRFGVAVADVRGNQGNDDLNKFKPAFRPESGWGEHQIVSSFDKNVGEVIDQALSKINKKGKKLVSTPDSDELADTTKISPLKPFKGYRRK